MDPPPTLDPHATPPFSDDNGGGARAAAPAARRASTRRRAGVDFARLDAATLKRYAAHFGLEDGGLSRAEMLPTVARHFSALPPPDEGDCLVAFAAAARRAAAAAAAAGE